MGETLKVTTESPGIRSVTVPPSESTHSRQPYGFGVGAGAVVAVGGGGGGDMMTQMAPMLEIFAYNEQAGRLTPEVIVPVGTLPSNG